MSKHLKKPKTVDLTDVVTFIPKDYFVEVQGRVMSLFNSDDGVPMATVAMLLRPDNPNDFVGKSTRVFEYLETDLFYDIEQDSILAIIPSNVYQEGYQDLEYIEMEIPKKILKKGFIYITGFLKDNGEIIEPASATHTVWAYHFHPENRAVLADPYDVSVAYYTVIKQVIFDPFVSPESKSSRRRDKNPNLWQLLLDLAPAVDTYEAFLPASVNHPMAMASSKRELFPDWNLLDLEKMIRPRFTIPFILTCLKQLHQMYANSEEYALNAAIAAATLLAEWNSKVEKMINSINSGTTEYLDEEEIEEQKYAGSKHYLEETEEDKEFIAGDDEPVAGSDFIGPRTEQGTTQVEDSQVQYPRTILETAVDSIHPIIFRDKQHTDDEESIHSDDEDTSTSNSEDGTSEIISYLESDDDSDDE